MTTDNTKIRMIGIKNKLTDGSYVYDAELWQGNDMLFISTYCDDEVDLLKKLMSIETAFRKAGFTNISIEIKERE
jgi:hypothetical protein